MLGGFFSSISNEYLGFRATSDLMALFCFITFLLYGLLADGFKEMRAYLFTKY